MDAGFRSDHAPIDLQFTHAVTERESVFCFNKHILNSLLLGTGIEGEHV